MQTIDVRLRNIIKNRQLTFANNPSGSALVNTVTALYSRSNYKMKPISIIRFLHLNLQDIYTGMMRIQEMQINAAEFFQTEVMAATPKYTSAAVTID